MKAMEFSWSPEQLALRERVIQFAQAELNDDVLRRDLEGEFSRQNWLKCGTFGIQGLMIPREYGGQGYDLLTTALAMEAMGYGCRDNGLTFALNAQLWTIQTTLLLYASETQKQRLLPGLCRGEVIGCYAMTEPEAGSDAYSARTQVEKCDGGYLLNGEKMLITFAPIADFALVFASSNPSLGKWGLSLFLVERGTPGFDTSPVQMKMGLRTAPIGSLTLKECFIPQENRIGPEGAGASMFNSVLEYERACILASQLGAMEYQLERAISYAQERKQFGQPIGKFQSISNRVAEMKLRLEIARLLLYKAAWLKQENKPVMLDAALANIYLGDAFVASSMDAMFLFGGRGYLTEYEVERDLRDAMGGPVYGGTSDIQRNIVARLLKL
jgi:alkylation response protein AidB-like acyl-CoA dehydrogenase